MELIPKIIQVLPVENYQVYLWFADGSVRCYDASPLPGRGGVFAPLADVSVFCSRATVMNDTLAWDLDGKRDMFSCVDLDPVELYESCPVVQDPLENAG